MRRDRAKICLAGQHDWQLSKNYFEPCSIFHGHTNLDCHFKSREIDGKLCIAKDWGQGLKTDLWRQRLGERPSSLFGHPSNL